MTTPVNEIVDSLKVRVEGAGNNTWPQLSVSPSNSLWLTDSADPLNTSPNAALQISLDPNAALLEALATDGVTARQLRLGSVGSVALVPSGGVVGIGTATPSQALDVAGAVKATSFLLGNTPIVSSQWASVAGGVNFAGGNVGIGVAAPSQPLEVAGAVKATSFLLNNTPIVSSQWTSGAGNISFMGGVVGIGTATPSQPLEVAGTVKATGFLLNNTPIVSSQWTTGAGGDLSFSGGNVGIGVAAPSQPLEVAGAVKASSFLLNNTPIVSSQWASGAGNISFLGGAVGIGVAAPSQPLEVAGAVKATSFLLNNTPIVSSQWTSGAGNISFMGGAVGIGVAAPSQPLEVAGAVKATGFLLGNTPIVSSQWTSGAGSISFSGGNVGIGTGSTALARTLQTEGSEIHSGGPSGGFSFADRGTGAFVELPPNGERWVWYASGSTARLWSNGDKLTVTPGGAVGIGNTGPAAKLDVTGDLKISGAFRFPNTGGGEVSLSNATFDNESTLQPNNVKVIMGASRFGVPGSSPPAYEFAVGDTSFGVRRFPGGGFILIDNFNKKFSVNQNGTAYFAGGKTGYVVDHFVNKVGDRLEQGDVVVLGANSASLFSGTSNNIPLPEVDLTDRAYDTRVCGIVAEVVTQQELPFVEPDAASEVDADTLAQAQRALETRGKARSSTPAPHPFQHMATAAAPDLDRTVVANEQLGQMVTLGAFAHCKVDADIAAIEVGDLLTTSPTRGHAQKVQDPSRAVGAIIGKALASLPSGKGKIPVLVMLQ